MSDLNAILKSFQVMNSDLFERMIKGDSTAIDEHVTQWSESLDKQQEKQVKNERKKTDTKGSK
jgi:TRAP-type C4-dicarboxylate transport system substrate-binding protein